jgi:hypothetical protein
MKKIILTLIFFAVSAVVFIYGEPQESGAPWLKPCVGRGSWALTVRHGAFSYEARVSSLDGKFRFEIQDPSGKTAQIFIYDNKRLYRLDYAAGRAYSFSMPDGACAALFNGVFPQTTALSRINRQVIGREKYNGRECVVTAYDGLMPRQQGAPAWVNIKEWTDRSTGAMIRAAGGDFETTVSDISWSLFMDGNAFNVPRGFVVTNMEETHANKEASPEKFFKITIPAGAKK